MSGRFWEEEVWRAGCLTNLSARGGAVEKDLTRAGGRVWEALGSSIYRILHVWKALGGSYVRMLRLGSFEEVLRRVEE